ncbi:ABC transporter permease [Thiobaca trueperi]|nr:ABC transporter permease [Thiobaca trueperi]
MIDLVLYKTYADLRAEAAKTYVNYLWWVLDPILSMLVFYVVFGFIFHRGGEGYVPFLLTGLVAWTWYNQTLSHAGSTILNGKGLINQVYVPKLVFPLVTFLTDLTKFAVVLCVLLLFLLISGYSPSASWLALPLVLLTQLLLCMALGLVLAAIVPYLPDLKLLVGHLLHLQFFLSGVFYSANDIPEPYRFWFFLNPMASLIHDYHVILLKGGWPHWGRLTVIALLSLLVLTLATILIQRLDQVYPRLVRQA